MATKRETFEKILTNKFDMNNFVLFTKEMLTGVEIIAPEKFNKVNDSTFYYYVENYSHVGTYTSDDGDRVAIFTVALKRGETVERARSMQRNFVKGLLTNNNVEGALVAFYTPEAPEKWRLSFVRIDYEFTKGKINEKLTPARRYSYLVGEKEPCHTAKKSLFPIFKSDEELPSIEEIEKAFSVEKVTDEFFNLYKEKYIEIKEWLEQCPDFVEQSELCGFTSEQFSKKLLGQLVFLYFVQKKGWLGVGVWPGELSQKEFEKVYYTGSGVGRVIKEYLPQIYVKNGEVYKLNVKMLDTIPDDAETAIADHMVNQRNWGKGDKTFVRTLFNYYTKSGKNFFDDVLEPLFYNTLNKSRGEKAYCPEFHCRIPFLNGGLFEELKGYDWKNNDFNIPNELFSNQSEKGDEADGVLDIFDRYNFTMNEDEPMEREVAIDPEMMGKVFENLLDVKDRKSKGAFYTPREIVHYMCQETLINYLTNKLDIPEDDVRDLVLYGDLMRDEDTKKTKWIMGKNGKNIPVVDTEKDFYISENILSYKNKVNRIKEIDDLLKNVKVADLAVGSGAFPLGMLSEIVKVRNVLTEYMAIGMSSIEKLSFINYGRKIYQLKTETIKNCLFACDIEPSAIDIAKLRLWLSIVIEDFVGEQDRNDGVVSEETKPKQLPNLDCNFICGNSLIDEFEGVELISSSDLLNNLKEGVQISMHQAVIDPLINNLIELQDKLYFEKSHEEKENIKYQIDQIYNRIVFTQGIQNDPDLNEKYLKATEEDSKPFILWQLYFPKVFRENGGFDIVIGNPPYGAKLSAEEKRYYKGKYADVHVRTPDTYNYFISLGFRLMRQNGIESFIVPNTLLFQNEYQKTRKFLSEQNTLYSVVNIGENVFEHAQVPTCIFASIKKSTEKYSIKYADYRKVVNEDIVWGNYPQTIEKEILMNTPGNVLGIDGRVRKILQKISNKSVLIDDIADEVAAGISTGGNDVFIIDKEFIKTKEIETDIIKPLLYGKIVDKYSINWKDEYVIYSNKNSNTPQYRNLFEYLKPFEERLSKKRETKKGLIPWWSLHWPRTPQLFEQDKIIMRQTSDCIRATYDKDSFYALNSLLVLTLKKECKYSYYYALGVLNSSVTDYIYANLTQESGRVFAEVKPKNVRKLYIPKMSDDEQKIIENLVIEIMNGKLTIDEGQKKINNLIYNFYNLSEDEIKIIEEAANE